MKIVFRTDASVQIGTGHVMRCLTLADALKSSGSTSHFICQELPINLYNLIRQHGHEINVLPYHESNSRLEPHTFQASIDFDWLEDAKKTINVLGNESIDWVVVDHYNLDEQWERSLRSTCNRLMVIDDLANRPHDCDLLLDQGLHESSTNRYNDLVPMGCKLLLGPKHVLLQPSFENQPLRIRTGEVRHVFVFFGGNDQSNQAGIAIQALAKFPQLTAKIVLGHNHPHKTSIQSAVTGHPRINLVESCSDMAAAMAEADLALGVCGMNAWERCAIGLPSIVCIIAENQRNDTHALERLGAIENLGDANKLLVDNWVAAISRVLCQPARLALMGEAAQKVVNGYRENLQLLIGLLANK